MSATATPVTPATPRAEVAYLAHRRPVAKSQAQGQSPVSLLPSLDPAAIDAATLALGGNRAAAIDLLSNPEACQAATERYDANQIKRLQERLVKGKAAINAVNLYARCMQDEPHFRERGEYVAVWSDILARVDEVIARDTADITRLLAVYAEPHPSDIAEAEEREPTGDPDDHAFGQDIHGGGYGRREKRRSGAAKQPRTDDTDDARRAAA